MPKKLGSFILSDKIIKKMKDKIDKNKSTKLEFGFSLFQKNNILIDRWHCVGDEGCIFPSDKCINGEKLVGGFHTHPKSNSDPSIGDLENAYREGFECIGGALDTKITCYVRKGRFSKSKMDDILITRERLGRMFLDTYENPEYLDKFREMKNNERCRILKSYFRTIEIR